MPELIDAVRLASILFVAGLGTTALFLATALKLLGENLMLQQRLRREPERIPNFVEEALRIDGPVKGAFRLSRTSKAIGDAELTAGSTLMLVISAANRDPRKFEGPNELRLERENARQHLAFGHGIHLCVGAPLARAESQVAIGRLLQRLQHIEISESIHGPANARRYEYLPSYISRGLQRLHLEFTSIGQW